MTILDKRNMEHLTQQEQLWVHRIHTELQNLVQEYMTEMVIDVLHQPPTKDDTEKWKVREDFCDYILAGFELPQGVAELKNIVASKVRTRPLTEEDLPGEVRIQELSEDVIGQDDGEGNINKDGVTNDVKAKFVALNPVDGAKWQVAIYETDKVPTAYGENGAYRIKMYLPQVLMPK